ncbi:unnamed protein product [Caenorhabditis sp. 36 PRJEB53466]|nr:unnamed protein product [Caenorhabditis sp. 36 PRJEB53466]
MSLPTADTKKDVSLVSADETSDMQGKLRCLQKLLKNPRARIPEVVYTVRQYVKSMKALMNLNKTPYHSESRAKISIVFKNVAAVEDYLIRVILCAEDPVVACQTTITGKKRVVIPVNL